jgi:uncharacterized protein YbcC (UPF0753/DUF2309 family)
MRDVIFDEAHILHELKHYLPTQTPLKDFIHHNSLHAFQQLKFYDAIFRASKIFGYQVTLQLNEFRKLFRIGRIKETIIDDIIVKRKGKENVDMWKHNLLFKNYDDSNDPRIGVLRANWKSQYQLDLDTMVQPTLFRILCNYLDQGISIWDFPVGNKSFLDAIRELEQNSFSSFFKKPRARNLLLKGNCSITSLLKIVVGDEDYFDQYLFDQQFSHMGWSGMVAAIESQPHTLLSRKEISLHDLIVFELLMEIDALDVHLGKKWEPLAKKLNNPPLDLFKDVPSSELTEIFKIWQDAFEWSYYDEALAGLLLKQKKATVINSQKSFQAAFCIDERECSIRRHLENTDPFCETFGTPGFFSVEFFFQPSKAKFYDKLCPAPVTPKYLIKEFDVDEERKHELLYTNQTHTFFNGYISSPNAGFLGGYPDISKPVSPKNEPGYFQCICSSA